MTILTHARLLDIGIARKNDNSESLLVEDPPKNEAKVQMPADPTVPPNAEVKRIKHRSILFLFVLSLIVASGGVLWGVVVCKIMARTTRQNLHRFQGWCAIPYESYVEQRYIEPQFHVMNAPDGAPNSEVEVFDTGAKADIEFETFLKSVQNMFQESFEIDKDYEKFVTKDKRDGRDSKIIHDFFTNTSGIIGEDRCFVMDLDRETVMPPETFVLSIRGKNKFDLTVVHNTMRAMLPPLTSLSGLGNYIEKECSQLPTYSLVKHNPIIKKRSADLPDDAKFSHFAGKHLNEIDVANINELIAYEESVKK